MGVAFKIFARNTITEPPLNKFYIHHCLGYLFNQSAILGIQLARQSCLRDYPTNLH